MNKYENEETREKEKLDFEGVMFYLLIFSVIVVVPISSVIILLKYA